MTPQGIAQLKLDEGCKLHAYPDPLTHAEPWTIGYGCTGPDIHKDTVWTQAQADGELLSRIRIFEAELDHRLPWWNLLNPTRKDVLVNMAFNMGVDGLLGFKNTLAMIQAGDYAKAADGMMNSKWASQVHNRAQRLADHMRLG